MLLHTIVLLFCYKNNSVDYHWDACYFAIPWFTWRWDACYFAILWFTTGMLAILLFCNYHWDACYLCYFAILWLLPLGRLLFMLFCYSVITTGTLAILLFMLFCYSVVITLGRLPMVLLCIQRNGFWTIFCLVLWSP